jgi:DNA gyrase subunit A
MGRATQGVRVIKLNDDDRISSVEKIQKIEDVAISTAATGSTPAPVEELISDEGLTDENIPDEEDIADEIDGDENDSEENADDNDDTKDAQ